MLRMCRYMFIPAKSRKDKMRVGSKLGGCWSVVGGDLPAGLDCVGGGGVLAGGLYVSTTRRCEPEGAELSCWDDVTAKTP